MSETPSLPPAPSLGIEIDLPEINEPREITTEDTFQEVQRADLEVVNDQLKILYAFWPAVKSISAVCRMVDSTCRTIETRRKVLCMPYGHSGESKAALVTPIE